MHPILLRLSVLGHEFIITTYGFSIALGVLLAFLLTYRRVRGTYPNPLDFTADLIFYILIPAFVGARLTYILAEFPDFLRSPASFIFARGGFVFYGGVILGFAGGVYFARKKETGYRQLADICTPGFGIAHFFGRIGCFLNGCCYGLPTNSRLGKPLKHLQECGVQFHYIYENEIQPMPSLRLPTQLYEAIFALCMTIITLILSRSWRNKQGQLFYLYIMSYSIFRFFNEFLRGDDRGISIFFLSFSQLISLLLIVLLIVTRKKIISHVK